METLPILPVEPWLAELEEQIRSLASASDPESIHRLRVAAGRLSVWLELGGRHALRDDLRGLRRSAASVRDLDVLVAKDRSPEWNATLARQREVELSGLREALSLARLPTVLAALRLIPAPDPERALVALARLEQRARRAGERIERGAKDAASLHRLRRRMRRWRYALEWLGRDAKAVKALQEVLGSLNDLAVELAHVDEFARRNGSAHADAPDAGPRAKAEQAYGNAAEHRAIAKHRATIEREIADESTRALDACLDAWRALPPRSREKPRKR